MNRRLPPHPASCHRAGRGASLVSARAAWREAEPDGLPLQISKGALWEASIASSRGFKLQALFATRMTLTLAWC